MYLRTPDTFQYSLEIEKRDFSETLPFQIMLSDEQKCKFFNFPHNFHGNQDFLFLFFFFFFEYLKPKINVVCQTRLI